MGSNKSIVIVKSIILICFLIAFNHCASVSKGMRIYDGPKLPRKDVGVLTIIEYGLNVVEIDGKKFKDIMKARGKKLMPYILYFRPGAHTILVIGGEEFVTRKMIIAERVKIRGSCKLKFTAKPGHEYLLTFLTDRWRTASQIKPLSPNSFPAYSPFEHPVDIFIIDKKSNKKVSSIE